MPEGNVDQKDSEGKEGRIGMRLRKQKRTRKF
jgi:hypothetical protein